MPLTYESWFEENWEELISDFTPEQRLKGLNPEDRLKGLNPEDRLKGLSPQEIHDLLEKYSSGK
ncbi:MAG: hypothetical protein PQJ58_14040 [Spirochaetales bacterium]|nr:hypothetical protein [Spirochaetales bacterium]